MAKIKPRPGVAEAQARVLEAEQRFDDTTRQIASRFRPGTLAGNTVAHMRAHRADLIPLAIGLYRFRQPLLTAAGTVTALIAQRRQAKEEKQRKLDARIIRTFLEERGFTDMSDNLKETAENAGRKVEEAAHSALEKGREVQSAVTVKAEELYSTSKDEAEKLGARVVDGIRQNPGAAIAGGLAFGVLVAALLPKRKSDNDQSNSTGRRQRLAASARERLHAVSEKLDDLGVNRENARQGLTRLRDAASQAAGSARQTIDKVRKAD